MKRLMLLILTTAIVISGCYYKIDRQVLLAENPQYLDIEDLSIIEEESGDTQSSQMPKLSEMDYINLTFKDDGYEIVELISVADGDTANFLVGGENMACRFLAIDAPELSGPSGSEPWALIAKEFTENALENADVIIIESDPESDILDIYDRLLVWVWVDGQLLNYQLVEEGLAFVKYLYGDYKYNAEMLALESIVEKSEIRIWGDQIPDFD